MFKHLEGKARPFLGLLGSFILSSSQLIFFFKFILFPFTFSLDKETSFINEKTQNLVSFTRSNISVCSIFFFFLDGQY